MSSTALVKRPRFAVVSNSKALAKLGFKAVKKAKRRKKGKGRKGKVKFFHPKIRSGWSKHQPAGTRRRLVLKAHRGNLLSSARSKQALANVTKDRETKVLAQADADYFYRLNREAKK